jgi:hypothetical protein
VSIRTKVLLNKLISTINKRLVLLFIYFSPIVHAKPRTSPGARETWFRVTDKAGIDDRQPVPEKQKVLTLVHLVH